MSVVETLKLHLRRKIALGRAGQSSITCSHLGQQTDKTVQCLSCGGKVELKVFNCEIHSQCTLVKKPNEPNLQGCDKCPNNTTRYRVHTQPTEPTITQVVTQVGVTPAAGDVRMASRKIPIVWSYGLTTVRSRRDNVLPRTLDSLRAAGFNHPHLFIDGGDPTDGWGKFGLPYTVRGGEPVRTFGNWCLSLAELYLRNPNATHYVIFQDDFVTYVNLRQYLEQSFISPGFPDKGYLNLFTFPSNGRDRMRAAKQAAPPSDHLGWYRSNQNGRGAVALIFPRLGVQALLCHPHMVERPTDPHRGHKSVDGGIVSAMNKAGWSEYVHSPTLVQHIGLKSSMGNKRHPDGVGFLGEVYNALDLIPKLSAPYAG